LIEGCEVFETRMRREEEDLEREEQIRLRGGIERAVSGEPMMVDE
jgi:hypothetical protein